MNLKDIIYLTILLLGMAGIFAYTHTREKKIVYVTIGELYDGFEMKKELERTLIAVQSGRKQHLDSLELELRMINDQIGEEGNKKQMIEIFEAKKEIWLQKKQQFEEDNGMMQDQYMSKIRKQLNQYVADYGKDHNCDYILGAEGSGVLMYAEDKDDVTDEVLTYVNQKYKGLR